MYDLILVPINPQSALADVDFGCLRIQQEFPTIYGICEHYSLPLDSINVESYRAVQQQFDNQPNKSTMFELMIYQENYWE